MRGSPELLAFANSARTDRKRFPHRFGQVPQSGIVQASVQSAASDLSWLGMVVSS